MGRTRSGRWSTRGARCVAKRFFLLVAASRTDSWDILAAIFAGRDGWIPRRGAMVVDGDFAL